MGNCVNAVWAGYENVVLKIEFAHVKIMCLARRGIVLVLLCVPGTVRSLAASWKNIIISFSKERRTQFFFFF